MIFLMLVSKLVWAYKDAHTKDEDKYIDLIPTHVWLEMKERGA